MGMTSVRDEGAKGFQTHPFPPGRAFHLVDLENLIGDPRAPATEVARVIGIYRATMVSLGDLVVIACNPRMAVSAKLSWPGILVRVGRGCNGADFALLREAQPADLASRFSKVVVASGDGIFAPLVAELRAMGIAVDVVGRHGSISRSLVRVVRERGSSGLAHFPPSRHVNRRGIQGSSVTAMRTPSSFESMAPSVRLRDDRPCPRTTFATRGYGTQPGWEDCNRA